MKKNALFILTLFLAALMLPAGCKKNDSPAAPQPAGTATDSPTITKTRTATLTYTISPTNSNTRTITPTFTITQTHTVSPTATITPTQMPYPPKLFGWDNYPVIYAVKEISSGGYILAGSTGPGVLHVKIDADGDCVWASSYNTYFGASSRDIIEIPGGDFVAAGEWRESGSYEGTSIMRVSGVDGSRVWQKSFGSYWLSQDRGLGIAATADGGYVIAGDSDDYDGNMLLYKTNSVGDPLWAKSFGEQLYGDWGEAVIQESDMGYVIAGTSWNYGSWGPNMYMVRTDSSGNSTWAKYYEGTGYGNDMIKVADGYIIAGSSSTYVACLLKADFDGDCVWARTWGSNASLRAVRQTPDGGYITAGDNGPGVYICRTDAAGNIAWEKNIWADITAGYSRAYDIEITSDNGFIIAGDTSQFGSWKGFAIKTDANGNQVW